MATPFPSRPRFGSTNIESVMTGAASARDPTLSGPMDALLFHCAHDIPRSRPAVEWLLSLAMPGARVAIAGIEYSSTDMTAPP